MPRPYHISIKSESLKVCMTQASVFFKTLGGFQGTARLCMGEPGLMGKGINGTQSPQVYSGANVCTWLFMRTQNKRVYVSWSWMHIEIRTCRVTYSLEEATIQQASRRKRRVFSHLSQKKELSLWRSEPWLWPWPLCGESRAWYQLVL